MASDHKAGESSEALATNLRFSFAKSRGPSSVQAKGFRAKIITILFANVELHREKKNKNKNKNKEEKKTNWRYRR